MQVKPAIENTGEITDSATLIHRESKLESKSNQSLTTSSLNGADILFAFQEISSDAASVLNIKEECTRAKKFSLSQQTSTETTRESA